MEEYLELNTSNDGILWTEEYLELFDSKNYEDAL